MANKNIKRKKHSILYQPTFHEVSCDMVSCWSAMFFWGVSIVLSKEQQNHRLWATGETGGQVTLVRYSHISWCINSATFQYVGPPKNCRKWRRKIQWILSGPKQFCTSFDLVAFDPLRHHLASLTTVSTWDHRVCRWVVFEWNPALQSTLARWVHEKKTCSSYEMEFSETDSFFCRVFLQFFILKCWRSIFWKGKPPGIISISERLFRREHDALFFGRGRQCLLNWPKRFANHIWVKTKHIFILYLYNFYYLQISILCNSEILIFNRRWTFPQNTICKKNGTVRQGCRASSEPSTMCSPVGYD